MKKDAKAGAEKAKKKAKEESAKAKAAAKETAAVAAKKAQETGNEATQARQLREELVAVAISSSGCKGGWRGLNGCSHLTTLSPHTRRVAQFRRPFICVLHAATHPPINRFCRDPPTLTLSLPYPPPTTHYAYSS